MAVEEIVYTKHYIGTAAERGAMSLKGIVPGSTFWTWDTGLEYIFANGAWKPKIVS
jgi:hypothetical protein